MKYSILTLALFPALVSTAEVQYTESIPFMYIEYGPGTILMPGTSITTEDCLITEVQLSGEGVFTIKCEVQ